MIGHPWASPGVSNDNRRLGSFRALFITQPEVLDANPIAEVTTPFDEVAPTTAPVAQEHQAAIESASDHVEMPAEPEAGADLAAASAQEPNVAPAKPKAFP